MNAQILRYKYLSALTLGNMPMAYFIKNKMEEQR